MVGRGEPKETIQRLLTSTKSEFLAVTGRRRVGKTYLIDEMLGENYCFTLSGIQHGDMSVQLTNFANKLSSYYSDFDQIPSNWQKAFQLLETFLRTLPRPYSKYVLFFDELPWIATARSGFLQFLAHFWNDYLSKNPYYLLVVCGSSPSWIIQKVINDPGGLHNRVTETIHLSPFNLTESQLFLMAKKIDLTDQEIVRYQMCLGGIPFYLDKIRRGESFAAAIERLCFAPTGSLRNEYRNLYRALFKNAELHEAIIEVLAQHPEGITHAEILQNLNISMSGSYQRAVEELLASDFIIEKIPFGRKKRGSIYQLVDAYSLFYHQFIKNNKKFSAGMWQQLAQSQAFKIWSGYAFEMICHRHVDEIKRALGIAAVYTEFSSLRVRGDAEIRGFQIDMIIDRRDDCINLCEVKYYRGPFTITKSYYSELIHKRESFRTYTGTKKQLFITLVTNHGVKENKYSREIVDSEISLRQLFGG